MKQAVAMARKTRRIDMFVWFLIRDEGRLSGWQSGVMTRRGARKPRTARSRPSPGKGRRKATGRRA